MHNLVRQQISYWQSRYTTTNQNQSAIHRAVEMTAEINGLWKPARYPTAIGTPARSSSFSAWLSSADKRQAKRRYYYEHGSSIMPSHQKTAPARQRKVASQQQRVKV